MKKTTLLFSLITMFIFSFGQTVDRDQVIIEIGTGTGCPYCPAAANGADDMVENGHDVGVIEYHNYNSNDPFNNSYAAARCSYYGITGYPTAYFDGGSPYVGGGNSGSLYNTYLNKYNQKKAIPSDFTIDINGNSPSGQDHELTIEVENVNNNNSSNLRLHVVITESEIPYNWQGLNVLDFVERRMIPDQNGTSLDFSSGDILSFDYNFTIPSSWVWENCQLVVFIQNHSTKQILQGAISDFEDLLIPLDNDAAVYQVSAPVTVCNEMLSPKTLLVNDGAITMTNVDITYSVNGGTETTYQWTGNLENDDSEWVNLPAIEIEDMLEVNTVEVTIGNPNGIQDEYLGNNTSSITFEQASDFENPPYIRLWIKTDDFPEETTWELKNGSGDIILSGGPYEDDNHLYFTDFDISEIDCYSFTIFDAGGNGFSDDNAKYYMTHSMSGIVFYQDNEFEAEEEVQFSVGLVGVQNNILSESFNIFPNPVQKDAWVMFETTQESEVKVKMFDISGKIVWNENKTVSSGIHSLQIDANNYTPGVYFIELEVNNELFKKKLVISN